VPHSDGTGSEGINRLKAVLDYDPGRLLVSRPSLDILHASQRFLAKKAEDLESRDIKSAPIYLNEVVRCLSEDTEPSRKAMRRVAAGGLPDLLARPNGPSLLARFIEVLVTIGSRTIYKALLLGYLRIGHENSRVSEVLRLTLINGRDSLPTRWAERIDRFGLLDKPVAMRLAQIAMSPHSGRPLQVFEEAGLKRGILLGGGFATQAFEHICNDLANHHDGNNVAKFLSFFPVEFADNSDERVQLTKNALPQVARALLKPYIQADPNEDIRSSILDVLIRLYRDPRLNPIDWANVDQDLVGVLCRWLTSESFEMLMEVLNSSNQSLQWKSREMFWRKFIKRDFVREAWIAFGPDAHKQAKKLIKSGHLRSRGAFGVLKKSQIQGHHSVLIMKIGDLTISEWTHDGKVRFYRSRNSSRPAFYELSYDPEVLRRDSKADYYKVHNGDWQEDVAEYIHEITGLKLR
jgi:hypothetical protein